MSTLIEKVNYIENIKSNIGKAITDKGGSITNDFGSYITAVNNLPTGEGGGEIGPGCIDLGAIGYKAEDITGLSDTLAYSKLKLEEWNADNTSAVNLYKKDKKLVFAPLIDTSKVINMECMYQDCSHMTKVPLLDTSNVTNMKMMFWHCLNLRQVPQLNTINVTTMHRMFQSCANALIEIPLLDTRNVTDMSYMFYDCRNMEKVPQFNTSKVTDMSHMFESNQHLRLFPKFDTVNVKNMENMLLGTTYIIELPALNTEKVENFYGFNGYGMDSLRKINELSVKSATNIQYLFNNDWGPSKSRYMLIKDLGTPESVTEYDFHSLNYWGEETDTDHPEIDLTGAGQTVVDSLLTYSFDRAAAGYPTCEFRCHANMKQYLTEEQITAIQNKGYTITF